MMDSGVAFGAGKAGQPFNVMEYITRPQVILRFLCWIFSTIVYSCIKNKGWHKGKCQFNESGNACRFGTILGFIGLIGAIIFLILEALFINISSIKVRRRIVAADLLFSGLWAALNFFLFASLSINWSKSSYPEFGFGINSLRAAIAFSLFSIPVWAGCAYFAWLRWKSGTDVSTFASTYPDDSLPPQSSDYYAYTSGTDPNEANYTDQGVYGQSAYGQYADQQQQPQTNFQQPAY